MGGRIYAEGEEFFHRSLRGKLELSLLAEGLRKIGLLSLLVRNGTLGPRCVLFWDEPETNLNPKLFKPVIAFANSFSCSGWVRRYSLPPMIT